MTLKLYKKRTKWYFKYRGIEYPINITHTLDTIESALDKDKNLYVKFYIQFYSRGFGFIRYDNTSWVPNTVINTVLNTFKPDMDIELLKLPAHIQREIHGWQVIEIQNIW